MHQYITMKALGRSGLREWFFKQLCRCYKCRVVGIHIWWCRRQTAYLFCENTNGEADNEKKITHSVLFVAVLAGTTALTLFAGRGNLSSTIYNFVFLAVIAVLYLIAMFGGMFRMNNLSTAFHRAVEELNGMFKTPGKTDPRNLTYLCELFVINIWIRIWTALRQH